jgi:putative hydrolase of HD superfamily
MSNNKLIEQMNFITEIEKLKVVYRQNGVMGGERQENSAEHSWHVSLMAIILQEYSKNKIDILKVIKMLLIHDIVEIHAGDTFLYDAQKREDIKEVEQKAAEKIFGLLPIEQKNELLSLWNEFEENKTDEAKYALVLDNLHPILNHYYTNNQNIKGKKLTKQQIINKKGFIKDFSEELWEFALSIIDKSVEIGLYEN